VPLGKGANGDAACARERSPCVERGRMRPGSVIVERGDGIDIGVHTVGGAGAERGPGLAVPAGDSGCSESGDCGEGARTKQGGGARGGAVVVEDDHGGGRRFEAVGELVGPVGAALAGDTDGRGSKKRGEDTQESDRFHEWAPCGSRTSGG